MTEELSYLPDRSWYEAHPEGAANGVAAYREAGLTPPDWLLALAGEEVTPEEVWGGVEVYLPEWQALWDEVHHNVIDFFIEARNRGLIDDETCMREINLYLGPAVEEPVGEPEGFREIKTEITDVIYHKITQGLKIAYREILVSLWQWLLEKLKELIDLVVDFVGPVLQKGWDLLQAKYQEYGRALLDGAFKAFEGHSPITPEDAVGIATNLYNYSMNTGLTASWASYGIEILHPLKQIGFQQVAGMIGQFAGFGRVSAAALGPLYNGVLGRVMTYAVQNRFRPQIPDERLLIEFASKREIDTEEFRKNMAYQGFSDYWSDIVYRWQWKDPRMFEIIRLADVGLEQGSPPASEMGWLTRFGVTGDKLRDWWLYRKFMRAGYEDCDLPVMVNFIHRREVAFALTYVRTAIRRNYRWGYLSDDELKQWMARLQLPEQAREWIFWAGELDREYFYRQDLQNYYVKAFRNDLIDSDELLVSLLAMNLPARDASLLVRTERIAKRPKAQAPVSSEQKAAAAKLQAEYIKLYREQFKKDLITEAQYLQSLLSIGLDPELAEVTVELDATKRVPALPA